MTFFFKKKFITLIFMFYISLMPINGQNKTTPIIPETNINIIQQEAENAIVTNFATQATLNYSASGQRTLQLNTYNSNYKSNAYFSEYVVYIDTAGSYSFWYSGTPPGTKDDVYPSYSSPFTLVIDENKYSKYREDVNVIENYAPGLYWIKAHEIELTAGYHKIRFEVNEKRRFDGKFYFYIDSFFLFNGDTKNPGSTPEVFPKNMDDRSIDNSFRSISYYQNSIKNNPTATENYMSLANIYILIGDYLNAIKMLSRIIQIDPSNRAAQLLMAKSRIWNGNTDRGIKAYEDYLSLYPDSLAIWEEAGKLAAWVGKLDKSIEIFNRGLSIFPGSISLNINLALTHLWNSNIQEGLDILSLQEKNTNGDVEKISNLADVYYINGYPDYAINFYKKSISIYPDFIKLYLNLEKLYSEVGESENAENILDKIETVFNISEKLKKLIDINKKKMNIKNIFIQNLEEQIELDPKNMELRELLVQTYFWNGIVDKSILEYKTIITINHLTEMDILQKNSMDLYNIYDILIYISHHFKNNINELAGLKVDFFNAVISYRSAIINNIDVDIDIAKENLQKVVDKTDHLLKQNSFLYQEFDILKLDILKQNSKENEDQEFFNKITSSNKWHPEISYLIDELTEVAKQSSSESIANTILARIYLTEENFIESKKIIDKFDNFLSKNKLFKYQLSLWNDEDVDEEIFRDVMIFYPELIDQDILLNKLNSITHDDSVIDKKYIDDIQPFLTKIELEQQKVSKFKGILSNIKEKQWQLIHNKLIRSIYKHQENTHLLRYTIGDYYLQSGFYKEALEQFNQVIAIDPYNISASFKLGRLLQLTGKWKEALARYEDVFTVDPEYQNAATMYNQLSIIHPEYSIGQFQYLVDSNRIEYREEFSTNLHLFSWLTLTPKWKSNTSSYFTWSKIGAPRKYRVDDLLLNWEFSLFDNSLIISPQVGVAIYNNKFNYISPIEDIDIENILNSGDYTPNLSITINKTVKSISLTGSYGQKLLQETSPSNIKDITTLYQTYTISGYFPIKDSEYLNSFSFRTYAGFDSRTGYNDKNSIYTLAQDFILGLLILKDPWTTLTLYSATTYENSEYINKLIYYSPQSVFVSKIGASTSSYIGVNKGVLSLTGRFAGGVYLNKLGIDTEPSFATDGEIQLAYNKNSRNLFFKLFASGSYSDNTSPDYWSIQASIGFNISLFKLLSP